MSSKDLPKIQGFHMREVLPNYITSTSRKCGLKHPLAGFQFCSCSWLLDPDVSRKLFLGILLNNKKNSITF